MTEPTLVLMPRRPALVAGHDNQVDVLVRLQAPTAPASLTRAPLNLAIVLDRSGSMSGRPLEEARRCAGFVIDRLGAGDRAALVAYDNRVSVLVAARPVTDRAAFHRALDGITEGGATALHDGWLRGAQEVAPLTRPDTVTRVLLLSDGQANQGLTDVDAIAAQCAELGGAGVGTSTYGLGRDFNEDLMLRMARAGQGSAYYGETAEDLMEPFEREFDLLSALCARGLEMTVSVPEGVRAEVLNDLPQAAGGAWRLPDLANGSEAWAVLRLRVPAAMAVEGMPADLVRVAMAWRDLDGVARRIATGPLAQAALPAAAWHAIAEDELVARRVGEVEAANLQDQARSAARRGDWATVRASIAEMRRRAADNPWLAGIADQLEDLAGLRDSARLAKEAAFAAHSMRSRLAGVCEDVAMDFEDSRPSFLQRKQQQGRGRARKEP